MFKVYESNYWGGQVKTFDEYEDAKAFFDAIVEEAIETNKDFESVVIDYISLECFNDILEEWGVGN